MRLAMWTKLELAWRLFLHCSWILGYWKKKKNSRHCRFLVVSHPSKLTLSHETEFLLLPSFKYYGLYIRHCISRYVGHRAFIWEHSAYLILDDQYSLPFSQGRLWPLMAYELTIKVIHSTHPDKNKSGYGHSSKKNTIMKDFWHSRCAKAPLN